MKKAGTRIHACLWIQGDLFQEAPLLKTRVHLRRDTAELLWKELVRVGWRTCTPQWGSDVEI